MPPVAPASAAFPGAGAEIKKKGIENKEDVKKEDVKQEPGEDCIRNLRNGKVIDTSKNDNNTRVAEERLSRNAAGYRSTGGLRLMKRC